ncbi:Crp/Fnr family transcriptional regulator [Acidithiobacillus sp. AMEEHan]|uniref:Crp/Fnr family transcriptional regulator n=1 Tax=Acidithiobacillus sp. AMEEHan TaxID=2994951 RepID=UPI0027E4E10A|nr:Crp/Fnr family transcriptional regulator [Acidithiobacillus sp. AMEEHan]
MRGESIFAGLTPVELCTLGMKVQDVDCIAGETLYRAGEPARYAYTLREGAVKLVKSLSNGQEIILRLLHHGDLFGFEGMHEAVHRHDAISLAPGQLCRLDLIELQRLSERLLKIREAIFQRWQQALRASEERVVELGAKKADARLAAFLLQWAQRYPRLRVLPFPLTRQDLADFLGLSVEHVSRLMAEFKRQELLRESRNQLEILAPQKLQGIATAKSDRLTPD